MADTKLKNINNTMCYRQQLFNIERGNTAKVKKLLHYKINYVYIKQQQEVD